MPPGAAREDGDFFPFTRVASTPSSDAPKDTMKPKRSLTPRGALFPSLDEAHRNITSRLVPANPFRNPSDRSQETEDIPLRDMTSSTSPDVTRMMDSNSPLPRPDTDFVLPRPSRSDLGRSLTARQRIFAKPSTTSPNAKKPAEALDASLHPASIKAQPLDTTGSTVALILDQYADQESDAPSPSIDTSGHGYTFSKSHDRYPPSPYAREGASARLGFRGDEESSSSCDPKENQSRMHPSIVVDVPPKPPAVALSGVHSRTVQNEYHANHRVMNLPQQRFDVARPQDSLRGEADTDEQNDSGLMPQPLRVPSVRDRSAFQHNRGTEMFADAESSIEEEISTDSNEDPFKYDSERYQRFLRPSKERDVSQALNRLGHRSTNGDSTLANLEVGTINEMGVTATASEIVEPESLVVPRTRAVRTTRRDRPGGAFFDLTALRNLHTDVKDREMEDDEAHDKEVKDLNCKVVIKHKQPSGSTEEKCEQKDDQIFGLTVDRGKQPTGRADNKLPHDFTSDGGDWVTEATSEVNFGTHLSSGRQILDQGIKATGSSLADYSDDDYDLRQDIMGSRDLMLHHPSRESLSTTYDVRNIKGTNQNVYLQRQAGPRLNGFAQNSLRLRPETTKPQGHLEPPPLDRKWSNPFKRSSYRRADTSSNFTYKRPAGPSKYEFRDSTSEYAPAPDPVADSNKAICGTYSTLPSTSMASIDTNEVLGNEDVPATIEEHPVRSSVIADPDAILANDIPPNDPQHTPRETGPIFFGDETNGTGSKFSFPLLNLREAQMLHKWRRESGETDETEGAATRYKRAQSTASSRPTIPLTPLQPSMAYFPKGFHGKRASRLSRSFVADLSDDATPQSTTGRALRVINTATPSPASRSTFYSVDSLSAWKKKKKSWFGQKDTRLLPVDKRLRRAPVQHTHRRTRQGSQLRVEQMDEDHAISYRARKRRDLWFYTMVAFSILPFLALPIYLGTFNDSLSWLTRGEVNHMTRRQKQIILGVLLTGCVIYGATVTAIIVYFVTLSKTS